MNIFLLAGIGALGIGATLQYFLGMKKNRWLAKRFSTQTEEILHPLSTEYVNIGGTIGYNFVYKTHDPWKEAKGTFTFFPRHSLLYMPISFAIGNSDRFYINIFTDKKLKGEGHIVERGHLKRAKIDDIDKMERREVEYKGKRFVYLWRNANLSNELDAMLHNMPEPETLVHFCSFDDNKTFFLYLKPKQGIIEQNLRYFIERTALFFKKTGKGADNGFTNSETN